MIAEAPNLGDAQLAPQRSQAYSTHYHHRLPVDDQLVQAHQFGHFEDLENGGTCGLDPAMNPSIRQGLGLADFDVRIDDFLTPRALALTQAQNPYGGNHFPVYEGEIFYKLWEQLSNVNNGILSHQPDWFTGPSVQKAKRGGSDVQRSHVCE